MKSMLVIWLLVLEDPKKNKVTTVKGPSAKEEYHPPMVYQYVNENGNLERFY